MKDLHEAGPTRTADARKPAASSQQLDDLSHEPQICYFERSGANPWMLCLRARASLQGVLHIIATPDQPLRVVAQENADA